MRIAMGAAAFICIFLGFYPTPLYNMLPYPVDFVPYTAFHVVGMLQLLMFGALAFTILILSGYYPAELRAVNLDTDWFFRMPGRLFIAFCDRPLKSFGKAMDSLFMRIVARFRSMPSASVGIENQIDRLFHGALASVPNLIFNWLKPAKTEASQLSWNMAYILLLFIIVLLTFLILVT
jgi:hypothetical protein